MQALSEFAIGSILPLLALLLYLRRRTKRGHGKISAWLIGLAGLLGAVLADAAVGLSHMDCGFYCGPDVVPYSTNFDVIAALLVVWLVVATICVIISNR